jgi:hypothetical protein
MDLTRRELLGVAVVSAATLVLPLGTVIAAPPPSDPYALDELPIQGSAGSCSCGVEFRR